MENTITLFLSAFFAATLLPVQSEAVLAYLQHTDMYPAMLLVGVATVGNVLGSVVNWFIGRYCLHFQDRKWFPMKEKTIKKASYIYEKWGIWTLLLAWLPFIGDPLTFVAGVMRTHIGAFLLLVTAGKLARYIAVIWWV